MSSPEIEIRELARRDLIFADIDGSDRTEVLSELASMLVEHGITQRADRLYEALWEREELQSTGVGAGVAIPHCKVRGLKNVVMAVATCSQEVDFDAPDGQPVRLIFLLLSPAKSAVVHLKSLACLSAWLRERPELAEQLTGQPVEAIFQVLSPDADASRDDGYAAADSSS